MRQKIKNGDQAYCNGAWVMWDENKAEWELIRLEDDIYFNGEPVQDCWNEPYVDND